MHSTLASGCRLRKVCSLSTLGWWNGRHVRLRGVCRKACGFKSRPEHFLVFIGEIALLGHLFTAFRTDLGHQQRSWLREVSQQFARCSDSRLRFGRQCVETHEHAGEFSEW